MNYSAYACALLGKKALERERVLELLEEVPDLPERAEVYLADGHLFLELAEPREGEVWALAEVVGKKTRLTLVLDGLALVVRAKKAEGEAKEAEEAEEDFPPPESLPF